MSRHEGVSCDACLRNNFRGRRYKCLVCYDYDLCSNCYESGSISTRHTAEHPMQCILTRADFELFYGGEALPLDQSQSLTCPHCGKMGFTDLSLADHVTAQHADATTQVVCPVCASIPNGEPNHMTEDLTSHLTVDHRGGGGSSGGSGSGARDLISFGDEPTAVRHPARRIPHPGRSVSGSRIRRFNMHFRESMDPITELLSQLSGVRRAASSVGSAAAAGAGGNAASSSAAAASQLQQLQMHLQLERQQYAQVARQASDRPPRRQITFVPTLSASAPSSAAQASAPGPIGSLGPVGQQPVASAGSVVTVAPTAAQDPTQLDGSRAHFLLSTISDDDDSSALESVRRAVDRDDRARFAQELVLSTLTKSFEDSLSICDVTKQLLQPPSAVASAASSRAQTGCQRSQKLSAVTSSGSSTTATSGSTAAVASSAARRPVAGGAAASTTAAVPAASLATTSQRQNMGGYLNSSSQQPTATGRTAAATVGTSSSASGRNRGGGATSRGGRGGGGAAASLLRVLDPAAASRGRRKPVLTRPPPPGNGGGASGGGSTSSVPSLEATAGPGGVRAAANGASDTR